MARPVATIAGHSRAGFGLPDLPSSPVVRDARESGWQTIAGGKPRGVSKPEEPHAYPTVLVAAVDREMRQQLVRSFPGDKCLVLEADTKVRLVEVVTVHSRPIHILLLDVDLGCSAWASKLKCYKSCMQVLLVAKRSNQWRSDVLSPEWALAKAKGLLGLPE